MFIIFQSYIVSKNVDPFKISVDLPFFKDMFYYILYFHSFKNIRSTYILKGFIFFRMIKKLKNNKYKITWYKNKMKEFISYFS